ncbi:MAG: hypothetical protein PHQ54_01255 [Candidatus Omnitrophica bacterium]|nr:hypothetical protein [Candidatus Omnitrophota bacterium]
MNRKDRIIFYFIVIAFICVKSEYFFKATRIIDTWEITNIFVSASVAKTHRFLPTLFHLKSPYGGGGDYLYSVFSVPFVAIFGSNIFSIRILSFLLCFFELLLIYYILVKYSKRSLAVVCSLLFILASNFVHSYSLVGMGRHFHLNLFFLTSLLLLLRFKSRKSFLNIFYLSISVGLGVYFYPAFSIAAVIFTLFVISELELTKISGWLRLLLFILVAAFFALVYRHMFIHESLGGILKIPWAFSMRSPKPIWPIDGAVLILKRCFIFLFFLLPDMLSFGYFNSGRAFEIVRSLDRESVFTVIRQLNDFYRAKNQFEIMVFDIYRTTFILTILALFVSCRAKLKIFFKNLVLSAKKEKLSNAETIILVSLLYFLLFIVLYFFNSGSVTTYKYYLIVYISVVIILTAAAVRRMMLLPFLFIMFIMPGAVSLYKTANSKPAYPPLASPVFYADIAVLEYIARSDNSCLREFISLNINTAHTLGYALADAKAARSAVKSLIDELELTELEARLLLEGWMAKVFFNSDMDLKKVEYIINELDDGLIGYLCSGLGEGLVKFFRQKNIFDQDFSEKIKTILSIIDNRYWSYFYQGIGRGLIRMFSSEAYAVIGPYLADKKTAIDYLSIIDQNYIDDFMKGFTSRELWIPVTFERR